jgi:magnesium chelatase family protein
VLNSALAPRDLEHHVPPDGETRDLLQFAAARFDFSARACGRILRVARTIADLAMVDKLTVHHVSEALLFRQLDQGARDTHSPGAPYLRPDEPHRGSGIH